MTMKNLRKLLTLSSAGLLLSTFSPSTVTLFAQEDTGSEETSEVMDSQSTDTEGNETTEEANEETTEDAANDSDYAFEVETEVINNEEKVLGTATFRQDTEGVVTLELALEGLSEGEYGMHIHTVGLATAPTFEDAGGHFNPKEVEHGTESETGPHAGDLPNLVVGEDGTVNETIEIPNVSLDPEGENTLNSTDGTSLIIHTGTDDYMTQPTGDAGDRQAAAVIFAPLEDSEFYQASDSATSNDDTSTSEEEVDEETTEDTE